MLVHWIWLATRPGISDRVKVKLLRHFQEPENIYFADNDAFSRIDGLTKEHLDALRDKTLIAAEKILHQCAREKLHILTYRDASYPSKLKNIPDPPVVLYYKGKLPDFDGSPLIGVVGTRKASAYGLTAAKRMGYQISKCGGIVVSGMAFGIDAMAMSGALTAGAQTLGVLGCGADVVYPPSNRPLFADVEKYGCILSEFPPGTPPNKWNFPRRNRIISGLSNGVLVVEAPEKSGALITANLALEQGRDVFVVPGNIDVATCVGSNRLLREGAIAVSTGWDVMSEYEALYPDKIRKDTTPVNLRAYPGEGAQTTEEIGKNVDKVAEKTILPGKKKKEKAEIDKKVIDNASSGLYSDVNKDLSALPEDQRIIAAALMGGERQVDDVIAEVGLPAAKVLSLLTMMELSGLVRRIPGKRIALK